MNKYKDLFLQQSYNDQYGVYKSVIELGVETWDYIVLTASNEKQAESYREQIEYRLKRNKLSSRTKYLVLPDPNGERVGSGGATLNVMREIAKDSGTINFEGLKILCIHSGGDSKRVPQYSACGKLFSPVPRELPDGRRSTLFDEFIIGMSGVPARINDGMLLCSGDVLLLFNPLQIDFYNTGAAAFSIKEDVSTAKNHGVYVADKDGNVGSFLHKQTEEFLAQNGAVDELNCCNIDTGAVIFSSDILADMYKLINTDEKFYSLVNEHVRLSLYADFNYPLASNATLEQYYLEIPEGDFNPELTEARTKIWEILHKYKMKLIRFSPAAFIHFGTTKELLKLVTKDIGEYHYLGWEALVNSNSKDARYAVSNSYVSKRANIGNGSYIEDCYIHRGVEIGENSIVSGVTLRNISVPSGVVLHGLKLEGKKFVARYYGVNDNPKEAVHFGEKINSALWDSSIFPVCDTMEEAVRLVLSGEENDYPKISLKDSFNNADTTSILSWQEKLDDKIKVEKLIYAIESEVPVNEAMNVFSKGITEREIDGLIYEAELLDDLKIDEFSLKIRICYYLSVIIKEKRKDIGLSQKYLDKCFALIASSFLKSSVGGNLYHKFQKIYRNKVVTKLPVRVNFGGGWSDTPPYCNEHGGTVLNVALALNGELPIEVTIKKLDKNIIALSSTDIGSYKEFTDIEALQDCTSPSDAFALHKAALITCGVIPSKTEWDKNTTVEEICKRMGGGIYLNTRVINIPKGSGLGTSSILAGACVKGLYEFFGKAISDSDLYNRVLIMEQVMSTCGGWQDQVGGLTSGFKMIMTNAGLMQDINCSQVVLREETRKELQDRFAIIYTGQRRLARNLLYEVIGRYIGNNKVSVETLESIQRMAVIMSYELQKGDINGFAKSMTEHWELSKKLDSGCTNTCIDQIFISIDDLIDGKMICGAGGGGFLQVVLKENVTKQELKDRISTVFSDSGVAVWDSQFC